MHRLPTKLALVPLLCLAGVVGLGGCARKKRSSPPVKPAHWQGLRMDMPRAKAEKQLRAAGLVVQCDPTPNVTYLAGDKLFTRWVKKDHTARTSRCTARQKKGVKPGPDKVIESKLYFLDDKLYRLHVKIISTDLAFQHVLKNRFGTLRQKTIERQVYASKRPAEILVWTLTRGNTQLLWLRSGSRQQLVLFTTTAARLKALQALSTTRKGD